MILKIKQMSKFKNALELLEYLNTTYSRLHTTYENAFWTSYMGDHRVDKEMEKARGKRDAFNSNNQLKKEVEFYFNISKGELKK